MDRNVYCNELESNETRWKLREMEYQEEIEILKSELNEKSKFIEDTISQGQLISKRKQNIYDSTNLLKQVSIAPSTAKNYERDWNKYLDYCKTLNLEVLDPVNGNIYLSELPITYCQETKARISISLNKWEKLLIMAYHLTLKG